MIHLPQGGQLKQLKPKSNRGEDLFDIDTNIRSESSEESRELRDQGQKLLGWFSETEKQLVSIAMGKTVHKEFEGGIFKGQVTNNPAVRDSKSGEIHMLVEYDDGDREDLPLPEIFAAFNYSPRQQLVKQGDKFKKDFGPEGIWEGTVMQDTAPFDGWVVQYADGSKETLPRREVEKLVSGS